MEKKALTNHWDVGFQSCYVHLNVVTQLKVVLASAFLVIKLPLGNLLLPYLSGQLFLGFVPVPDRSVVSSLQFGHLSTDVHYGILSICKCTICKWSRLSVTEEMMFP